MPLHGLPDRQRLELRALHGRAARIDRAPSGLQGQPELFEVELPDGRRKRANRCANCATNVWGSPLRFPQLLILHPGTLDDTSWLEPAGHIWTCSAQPWVRLPAESLCYEQQPEDMMALVRAWKARSGK
ncbi:MAG TPA: GFA family protein [Myxococcota bacterium]|nr:GFA family protein [Myxococcota bacterium]